MEERIYFSLLILCSIVQLIGTSKTSSVLHILQKRMIDKTLYYGSKPTTLRQVPYIVNIVRNGLSICGGSILTPVFILTAAHCIFADNYTYTVLSNSASFDRGIEHAVIKKLLFADYIHRYWGRNDLALLNISPAINFLTSHNEKISLYTGNLPRNSHGIVSGWGCYYMRGQRTKFPSQLRSFTVPILSEESCREKIEIGTLSEVDVRKSSDLHIRKKRIIDTSLNGNRPVSLQQAPYMVNILRNEISYCGGSILDPTIILTAAHCVSEDIGFYSILSNSAIADRGVRHKIIRKIIHPQYEQHQLLNDLALLVISPPINFETSRNRRIPICNGHLPPNSRGIISGWGCHRIREGRMEYPFILRSITVPVISMKLCRTFYRYANLTNRNMCTLDGNREKNCAGGDSGGSLVVNGQLLGVLSWAEETSDQGYPDVFINLIGRMRRNAQGQNEKDLSWVDALIGARGMLAILISTPETTTHPSQCRD
ncbi:phenoloxidase-activating factor 2-like [Belonocnema kinseyi]|uniref:phenoloxidase-activating factor 2-like n=1 Tax=Belonocnema kinseyi TaxID=2817044 RepID=UPI00143D56EA|nr:phenoloxidase-activating factor 2-like [Belonocnema kinseyi]